MNGKYLGELAEQIVIGELAKYQVFVAYPLSDNLPFDLVAIAGKKLFKIQVKGSTQGSIGKSVTFNLTSNNFYTGATIKYQEEDVDVMFCVNLRTNDVYCLQDFVGRRSVTFRFEPSKNNQVSKINFADDYRLSKAKIKEIFGYVPEDLSSEWARPNPIRYEHICENCGKKYNNGCKNQKYCTSVCRGIASRKTDRPIASQLQDDIDNLSMRAIGRKYDVSDNAVRKWAKSYGL